MKPVKITFTNEGAEEWKRLNEVVAEEISNGIKNSDHQKLLKSIKQKLTLNMEHPFLKS